MLKGRSFSETRNTVIDMTRPININGDNTLNILMPAAHMAVISSCLFMVPMVYIVEISAAIGAVCRIIKGIIDR